MFFFLVGGGVVFHIYRVKGWVFYSCNHKAVQRTVLYIHD